MPLDDDALEDELLAAVVAGALDVEVVGPDAVELVDALAPPEVLVVDMVALAVEVPLDDEAPPCPPAPVC